MKCEGRTGNCIVEIANRDDFKLKMGSFREETQFSLINFMIIRKKFVSLQHNREYTYFEVHKFKN